MQRSGGACGVRNTLGSVNTEMGKLPDSPQFYAKSLYFSTCHQSLPLLFHLGLERAPVATMALTIPGCAYLVEEVKRFDEAFEAHGFPGVLGRSIAWSTIMLKMCQTQCRRYYFLPQRD
jgi:hypothetical protein